MVLVYKNRIYLRSQKIIGATMMLPAITHGLLTGWLTASLSTLRSADSPITINDEQISWIASIQFIGKIVSALPTGMLLDKYGCKSVKSYSLIFPISSWLLFFLTNYIDMWELLFVMQILSGMWIGISEAAVQLYVTEIVEPNLRGGLLSMYHVIYKFGTMYTLLVSLILPYKYLTAAFSIFLIIFAILFLFVPETPQYYIKRDDMISAKHSLTCIRHNKTEDEILFELKEMELSVKNATKENGSLFEFLSSKSNRKALFIVQIVACLQKVVNVTSVITYYALASANSTSISPITFVLFNDILKILSGFIISLLYNLIGSKRLIMISSNACSISMYIAAIWYFLYEYLPKNLNIIVFEIGNTVWIPATCLLIQGIGCNIGINPVSTNVRNEYLPLSARGTCFAVTTIVSGLTVFLLNKTYINVANSFGIYVNFLLYGLCCSILTWFCSKYLLHTTGKTLQQIQDDLKASSKDTKNDKTVTNTAV